MAIHTDAFLTPLAGDTAVIACHFNPCGYQRPRRNLARFLDGMASVWAPVFMAELAFYGQPHQLPACDRTALFRAGPSAVMFQKERLLNLAEKLVPPQFTKIIAWDADVLIRDENWLGRVSRALDDAPLVHPYSRALWLGPNDEETGCKLSTGYGWNNRFAAPLDPSLFHPGLGIAVRRSFFQDVGGFEGCVVTGSGDTLTVLGALDPEPAARTFFHRHSAAWSGPQLDWCRRMHAFSGGRIGVVPTDLHHLYHGSYANRAYLSRFGLVRSFDPVRDLMTNDDGVTCWSWTAQQGELPGVVSEYFAARAEDD